VFFELLWCCFQVSQPVYPLLWMWQQALDEQFTLSSAISQIISWHTPTLLNLISPHNNDSTCSIHLLECVVLVVKDPSTLTLTNASCHAAVDHDISFVPTRSLCTLQLWNLRRRVLHHRDHDFTSLRSDFSKPSDVLHWLLLWYINETQNTIAHNGKFKFNHWHHF